MRTATLATGELIASRYRLEAPVDRRTWRAFDERLARSVAITSLEWGRPVPAAAGTAHPNLVRIFDLGQHGGKCFLVTELPEGETLAERIGRGPVPAFEAGQIGCGILGAVSAIHRAGLRLGRLRAIDVLLDTEGRPRLQSVHLRRARLGDGGQLADLREVGRLLESIPLADDAEPIWSYVIAGLQARRIRTAEAAQRQLQCPAADAGGQATQEFDVVLP